MIGNSYVNYSIKLQYHNESLVSAKAIVSFKNSTHKKFVLATSDIHLELTQLQIHISLGFHTCCYRDLYALSVHIPFGMEWNQ